MTASRDRERGAAAVEFAIVAPLLFALIFGIIDFGWFFNQQISVTNAARESSRYAAIHFREADAVTKAIAKGKSEAPSVNWASPATFTVDIGDCADGSGDAVSKIKTPATSISGWFVSLFSDIGTVTTNGRMICGG